MLNGVRLDNEGGILEGGVAQALAEPPLNFALSLAISKLRIGVLSGMAWRVSRYDDVALTRVNI